MQIGWGMLIALLVSLVGTGLLVRFAGNLKLVQVPVARSSHIRPTPTGGGLAVLIATLAGIAFAPIDANIKIALGVAALLGLVGVVDDLRDLSPRLRLVAQAVAVAAIGLFVFPPVPGPVPLILFALALFAGLWWVNLFNFMDGIDGLAASQALFMLLVGSGLATWEAGAWEVTGPALVIAAAIAGFIVWNWSPARIFMGDVGSLFIGLALFAFGALAVSAGQLSLPEALILSALFSADATATLLVRLRTGQNIFAGHKSHAYQILSRRLGGHARASLAYLAVNLLVVLPVALLARALPAHGLSLAIALLLVLGGAALAFGAGRDKG